MRTNIVIDDALMSRAMKLSGAATKRETVENALKLLIRLREQKQIRAARGKLKWTGNLQATRRDR